MEQAQRAALSHAALLPAKSFRSDDPALMHLSESLWLSLPQHLRDSADVAMALAEDWLPELIVQRLTGRYGLSGAEVQSLLGFLAGTHDVGKAELCFVRKFAFRPEIAWLNKQAISTGLFDEAEKHCDPTNAVQHSAVSDAILRRQLLRAFPTASYTAVCTVTSAAGCHHGVPSGLPLHKLRREAESLRKMNQHLDCHGVECEAVWTALTDDILQRTDAIGALEKIIDAGGLTITDQLMISGFVSMSDWIASNQELFPLTESGSHSSDESRAESALHKLGLTAAWRVDREQQIPFRKRFGWPENASLRSCQKTALDAVAGLDEPALVVISEEMGRGKTEAALLAGESIAGTRGAGGLVFGLPTQVTANAMLPRIEQWLRSFSGPAQRHSLRLAHGRAHLSPEFEQLIRHTRSVNTAQKPDADDGVIAHEWFSGRKSLLSDFTVSTVDQVLMTALQSRYVTLRHLGVAGKVIVLDEVHSLDAYSSAYLERTLTWLAAHGVSVILLSATLDSQTQTRFEQSYMRGFQRSRRPAAKTVDSATAPSYPEISVTTARGTKRHPVESLKTHRRVLLEVIDDDIASFQHRIDELTADGGVIGVVCNTVERAQDVFNAFVARWPDETVLLHSQLTAAERARREATLTSELGKHSSRDSDSTSHRRPHRRIVVGTQVLEQSLDVDFDLLVSDFAPVDSLAQRAGRLHRHDRPEVDRPAKLHDARVLIRGAAMAPRRPPEFNRGSEAIYGAYRLLASAAALNDSLHGSPWCIRHDLYSKIEAVGTGSVAIPAGWNEAFQAAEAEHVQRIRDSRSRAEAHQIGTPRKTSNDLSRALLSSDALDADRSEEIVAASVRDIEPSLEALLVMNRAGVLYPLPWLVDGQLTAISETQAPPRWLSIILADSAVRIPRWLVPPHKIDDAIDALEANGIAAWKDDFRLRGQLTVEIDENFHGQLLGKDFWFHPSYGFLKEEQFIRYGLDADGFQAEQEDEFYDDF